MQQKRMRVDDDEWECSDGTRVRRVVWKPDREPKAWMVGVHGLNCTADDLAPMGAAMAGSGMAFMTWNLRGQGFDPRRERRAAWLDVREIGADIDKAVKELEPATVFLAGDSMGALLALNAAATRDPGSGLAGLLLFSPVAKLAQKNPQWVKQTMCQLSRWFPRLKINPSWFIHGRPETPPLTRIEKRQWDFTHAAHRMHGFTPGFLAAMDDLMGGSSEDAQKVRLPTALFSGGRDVFVRAEDSAALFEKIASRDKTHFHYPEGFHQLLHDLDAESVIADAVRWTTERLAY